MITETLWIVNTRTCNLDCSYCYQGSHKWKWQEERGLQKMMNRKTLDRTLQWATQWANRGLRIAWYGGEPLLNRALMAEVMPQWEVAFAQVRKDLEWGITTNGTMLDERARALLDKHKVGVLLSLDGPPEIHDKQRTYYQGKPSWHNIPTREILAWRPQIEIAWQVDPNNVPEPQHLDWMLEYGFSRINFNLNWLKPWPAESRIKLQDFMRWVARRHVQSIRGELEIAGRKCEFSTNVMAKFNEIFLKSQKPAQPCGTGTHMLAVTPEGFLYPSQEMAFKAFEPGTAPGTAEYYRVGNVWHDDVIDRERLNVVSSIQTADMRTPPGFDCNNCAANPISFGGCHCRYIGQDGRDPSNRYDVAPGWCQSMQSMVAGLMMGAKIERYITLQTAMRSNATATQPQMSGSYAGALPSTVELPIIEPSTAKAEFTHRIDLSDVYREVLGLKRLIKAKAPSDPE